MKILQATGQYNKSGVFFQSQPITRLYKSSFFAGAMHVTSLFYGTLYYLPLKKMQETIIRVWRHQSRQSGLWPRGISLHDITNLSLIPEQSALPDNFFTVQYTQVFDLEQVTQLSAVM